MQIILIPNARKESTNLTLGIYSVLGLFSVATVVSGLLFHWGYQYARGQMAEILSSIRTQTSAVWEHDMAEQRELLNKTRIDAEESLDVLASRLSLLQGHVMRLDALGSRLASMAKLDDIQFGVENPPGMGGPAPKADDAPVIIPDLLKTLDDLELTLDDREEKLSAMESMLINRTLQEQTLPGGNPSKNGWISSLFGYRTDPLNGKREFHEGIDFAGKLGTPITAVAAGIVTWSGPRYGYGNLIEVSHGKGYITRYAHNSKNLVTVGEKVEKGEVIGLMGSSGRSTGPHVHFEVLHYGRYVDPRQYLSLK